MRARGPVTNPTARALASWLCALWGRHEAAWGGHLLPGCGASRGRALSHPRPLIIFGVRPGPTTHWLWMRGVRAWGPVTNPTARALARWRCTLWGRQEGAGGGRLLPGCGASLDGCSPTPDLLSFRGCGRGPLPTGCGCGGCESGTCHPPHSARSFELALRALGAAGCPGGGGLLPGCGASWVGRSPAPNDSSFRACGRGPLPTGCGCGGCWRGDPSPTPQRALLRAGFACCGGGTRAPGGAPLAWVWGVRGRALSHPRPLISSGAAGARFSLAVGAVCGRGGPAVLGTFSRAVVRRVLCALPGFAAPGGPCGLAPVLVPWLWPAACLCGVPRGPALVRRDSCGPVALGAAVGFPVAVVPSPTPGAVVPGFTGWLRGALGGRATTGVFVPVTGACRGKGSGRAPRRTRSGPRDGVVPGGSLRLRSWAACAAVVWCVWTRSLTRPVSRTIRLSTGDSAGAPGTPTPSLSGRRTQARVPRVCACACFLGRVGRGGLPGAFECASPFPVAVHGALFVCSAPSRLGSPCLWFFLLSFPSAPALSPAFPVFRPWVPWALACCAPPPSLVFFFPCFLFCAPSVSGVPCFPALGALGLGVLCPAPPSLVFFVFFSLLFRVSLVSGVPCFPALGALGLGVLRPPPSLSCFFFSFPFFCSCAMVCRVCGAAVLSVLGPGACWCVLLWALCFDGGLCALALHRSVPPACASSFLCACVARAPWGRAGSVALPRAASGVCWFCPPPLSAGCGVLCCA